VSDSDDVTWTLLDESVVGEFSAFRVLRHAARSPRDGSVQRFDVVDRPDCVQVIAHAPDGRLIMVEQYRHGMQRVTLEFPAGVLDQGEDPVGGAIRELAEETGYHAERGSVIGVADLDSAIETSRVHIVRLQGCRRDGVQQPDSGEAIRVRLIGEDDFDELIRGGVISQTAAIAAWYYAQPAG